MLKIVIVDDEENVRIVIKKLLTLINIEHEIVGEASSVNEGVDVITKFQPDIVLLDIKLDDGTGFDLLKKMTTINFQLVFITAYNNYAIKAFKFNALDYILKPIDPTELNNVILKAKNAIHAKNEIESLLKNMEENKTSKAEKLVIKTTKKTYFIAIEDLIYFQSDGSYAKVVTKKYKMLASKNLKYFQEILPSNNFVRTHQSFLINKQYVLSIEDNIINMIDGTKIPISVRKRAEIKKMLN